jgi:hypothetical protein
MTNPIRHLKMKMKWLIVGLGVLATVGTAGTAIARTTANGPDPSADVLARIGSPRLLAGSAAGGVATVKARASEAGADSARSLWYATVAGAAIAQKGGASAVTRTVVDSAGAVIGDETDVINTGGPDAFAPLDRSAADVLQSVRAQAHSRGARLLSSHFIRLFGGTAELVIQPNDPAGFVASAGANVSALLGDLQAKERPYLVTVVDSKGTPLLVLGYTPRVGGTIGQGIGWQAPEASSDAIWGATDASHKLP